MKKLLVLLLALALLAGTAGCVAQPVENATNAPALSQQTEILKEEATQAPTEALTEAPTEPEAKEIGEEKAKKVALKHAGLEESEVTALFVELDHDDGILRYEVDFHHGGYEYDYDIDAKTAKILSYDKDFDD